ncbi:MAG: hypothetical protein IPK16_28440 [Anaerolineales bacterium]|nr:hypothetical protein [Anaerolineales bacterium]
MRRRLPVELPGDALLLAQAAGVMEDDESVRWLLTPLADWTEDQFDIPPQYQQAQLFLAIADANLGDTEAARQRLQDFDPEEDDHAQLVLDALDNDMPGLGLVDRFAYYLGAEMLPLHLAAEIMELIWEVGEGNNPQAEKDFKRIVARYPQLVLMAEKLVWEEDDIDFGLMMLRCIGTPAAHAALRRFALGQLGSDAERMAALLNLQASGGVEPGERFMVWRDDAWESVQPRNFRIGARYDQPQLRPKVAKLMEEGMNALGEERIEEAESLLRQVIALEPKALSAYNNLASMLRATGDETASRALLEQALAVNPNYLYARANLALMAMDEDIEAAEAFLAPLAAVTNFTADEFAFYQYTLAQLAVRQNDDDNARRQLAMGLAIHPDHEPSLELLATLAVEETPILSGLDHKSLADLAKNFADNLRRLQGKD